MSYTTIKVGLKKTHFIPSISKTVTNAVPLCSVYQALCYQPNLILLAPVPTGYANLSMLLILEVVCKVLTSSRINSMLK